MIVFGFVCLRTHFNYEVTEHGEMAFKHGDVFQITDTLYSGVVGSWQAIRIARTSHEARKGIIPNLSRSLVSCYNLSASNSILNSHLHVNVVESESDLHT